MRKGSLEVADRARSVRDEMLQHVRLGLGDFE